MPLGRFDGRPLPPLHTLLGTGLDARQFTDISALDVDAYELSPVHPELGPPTPDSPNALWDLPFYGWLILVSAWARKATFVWATAMILEAALSFIGAGTPPTTPSWGNILADARSLWQIRPTLVFFPGVFLFTTLLAVNLLGDGLRDLLDPRQAPEGSR